MRYWLGILGMVASVMAGPALAQTKPASGDDVKAALATCFACHGPGGVSRMPSHPNLAGQKATYVLRQLLAFKRAAKAHAEIVKPGTPASQVSRTNPIMEHRAASLDTALAAKVAVAVSQLACRADGVSQKTPKPPALVRQCSACHGNDGLGVRPEIPNLAGQKRTYLRRQLLLIREAAWGGHLRAGESWRRHPIMERQTARLKIEDLDALARYYADLDCRGSARK